MKFYMTITDHNSPSGFIAKPIEKPYITACDGYTILTHKSWGGWSNTEAVTGLSFSKGHKTLKEAREAINQVPRETTLKYLARAVTYLESCGYKLENRIGGEL